MRLRLKAAACLVAAIAAGAGGTSAFGAGYSVASLGENPDGELGNGTTHDSKTAVVVETASGGPLSGITAISAGEHHTLALLENGEVLAWGKNMHGQLGDETTTSKSKAVPVKGMPGAVKAISAGAEYSLALLENGHVMAWGWNEQGQLGDGETTGTPVTKPVEVKGLEHVAAISAGEKAGYALLENGHVLSWGENRYGELGNGVNIGPARPEPGPVELPETAIAIAGGGYQALALLSSGKVAAWGANAVGQLGEPEAPENDGTPLIVPGVTHATAIASGYWFSVALLESGKVEAWGENGYGQLGNGSFGPEKCKFPPYGSLDCDRTPGEVSGLAEATAIAAGYYNSYALRETGLFEPLQRLYGWGYEDGLEAGKNTTTPVIINTVSKLHSVTAGRGFLVTLGPPLPTVTHLSKTSGSSLGGELVTITGTHLTGAKAFFGTAKATASEAATETSLTVETPAHAPQTVDVTVITSSGTSPKVTADSFKYLPSGKIAIGRCHKEIGLGAYKDSSCTEPLGGGNWKWEPGVAKAGVTAKPVAETEIAIESMGGTKIICTGGSAAGEYRETTGVRNVTLKLTGCELGSSGPKCTSSGAATGEISSSPLEGAFGSAEPETNKVGLELYAPLEGQIAAAECGGTPLVLAGEVIGQITPTNAMRNTFTVKFKQKKGVQAIQHFWSEINNETLEMSVGEGPVEQAGLALEATLTNEEQLEIDTAL